MMRALLHIWATLLEVLATFCALISPVVILHWLLGVGDFPIVNQFIQPLTELLAPLNQLVGQVLSLPAVQYQGHSVNMEQAVLGFGFTVLFFVLSTLANMLKTSVQKLEIAADARAQGRRMKAIQKEQASEKKMVRKNQAYLVFAEYDFPKNPTGTQWVERYPDYDGTLLQADEQGRLLRFQSLQQALAYCAKTSLGIQQHYETLRPMDPQPPYHLSVHALEEGESLEYYRNEVRLVSRYTGQNQIVFSQNVKALMDLDAHFQQYRFQSLGFYDLSGALASGHANQGEELFLLL